MWKTPGRPRPAGRSQFHFSYLDQFDLHLNVGKMNFGVFCCIAIALIVGASPGTTLYNGPWPTDPPPITMDKLREVNQKAWRNKRAIGQ